MTMLRGGVILAAGTMAPRHMIPLGGVQVYPSVWWAKKPITLRNPPHTIIHPTKGQRDARIHAGEAGKAGKGSSGFEDGLPAVAARVKTAMKGFRSAHSMRPDEYPSVKRHTFRTLEELKAMREVPGY